jgi:tRNA U34 5-carboxymethylaminomethyl modifying GTPase MnmE/TrmE
VLSAIRYLHSRNATYMTNPEEKQNESTIIKHILQANKYSTSFGTKHNKQQYRKDDPNLTNKKWVKFTYIGKDTRAITKLIKHTNILTAFTTTNNLGKLLTSRRDDQYIDIYSRNCVYLLTCNTCHKRYIGQTDAHFEHALKNMNKIIDTIAENHCMQNIFWTTTIHFNLSTTACMSYIQRKREDY